MAFKKRLLRLSATSLTVQDRGVEEEVMDIYGSSAPLQLICTVKDPEINVDARNRAIPIAKIDNEATHTFKKGEGILYNSSIEDEPLIRVVLTVSMQQTSFTKAMIAIVSGFGDLIGTTAGALPAVGSVLKPVANMILENIAAVEKENVYVLGSGDIDLDFDANHEGQAYTLDLHLPQKRTLCRFPSFLNEYEHEIVRTGEPNARLTYTVVLQDPPAA
jgi:hypothetical protein